MRPVKNTVVCPPPKMYHHFHIPAELASSYVMTEVEEAGETSYRYTYRFTSTSCEMGRCEDNSYIHLHNQGGTTNQR
jgi:hypothetical protein